MLGRRTAPVALVLTLLGCGARPQPSTVPTPTASGAEVEAPIESRVLGVGGAFTTSLDVARTSFGAVALGPDLYVAGGYFGEPHRYSREGQSASFARLAAHGEWQELAALDTGLQGLALVALDGDVVRCGGSRVDNASSDPTDMHSIAACARYRVADDRWGPFPELPEPRSSFDAVALGERIYAAGGWNVDGDSAHATFATTLLVFDAASGWRAIAAPFQRRALAVTAAAGRVVVVGGLTAELTASTDVDVFDPSSETWTSGPPFPGEGFGMSATSVGDTVLASGQDGVVYGWRPGEPGWTAFGTLALPRFFHRLVAHGDGLVALGGIGSMTTDGRVRVVESLSLAGESPRASWLEISFPGRARNRSGLFAQGDSLFVLGGNDSPEQHDFAPTNFVAEAFRLHVPSLRWFPLSPLAEGRQSLEATSLGDAALALGGFGHDEDAPRTYGDAFTLDAAGAWRLVRDVLPLPRTQFGLAHHAGAIWIFGGLRYDDALPEAERFTHLDDVLRCELDAEALAAGSERPVAPCVEVEARMPGTRRAFGGATLGERFYFVGGMRDGFAAIDDCFSFDYRSRTFAPIACPRAPRISPALLPLDGRLYLVGGSSRSAAGLATDRSVEVFDPALGTWSTLIEELPFDTHQGRWVVLHHRLVMLSTQAEAGRALLAWVDVAPR